MTTHPVGLAEDHITIGPVAVRPRGSSLDSLLTLLGSPDRVVSLPYNSSVYVYDYIGIRFWAKAEVVGEWQLVLETEDRETFPRQPFVGPVDYLNCTLHPPVAGDSLTTGTWPGFVQDTDPLQYGIIMFVAKKPLITYTAIVSAQTGNIKRISVT